MTRLAILYSTIRRECSRIKASTPYLMLLSVLPAISILFFASIFRHGTPDNLPIALLDEDDTTLSLTLAQMIDATPEIEISCSISDIIAGQQALRRGEVDAVVVIPQSFEQNIYSLSQTSVGAYISGANILKNGLISKGLLTSVTTFNTGLAMQTLQAKGLSKQQAMAQAMPITFDKHILFNPYTNYEDYLSPLLMPMMIVIFASLATIFAIGTELRDATSREWLATAHGSLPVALAGKLATIFAAMCFWSGVAFFTLFYLMEVPLRGSAWLLIAGGGVVLLAYMSIAIVITAATANMRLALSLGGGYTVMSFSLCGLTYPSMAMHTSIQYLSKLFPFTYFANLAVDQAMRGTPIAYSIDNIGYMAAFLLPCILLLHRLKQVLTTEKYFGRE